MDIEDKGNISVSEEILNITLDQSQTNPIIRTENFSKINILTKENIINDCILRVEGSKANLDINVSLDKNAQINLNLLRLYSNSLIDVKINVEVDQDAKFTGIVGEFSPSDTTYDVKINLNKPGSEGYFRLACIAQNNEKKKVSVNIINKSFHSFGKMDNYGVVKEHGNLTIEGIGTMNQGAYGSTSDQNNRIIIFDETAFAQANPYLYIDEYDVKASHSCSVGQIDEQQIYYLMSRGLSYDLARRFISLGYLTPILEYFNTEDLKIEISEVLSKKVEK